MATKREPGKKATPRKRTTKRSPRQENSNITAAQKATQQKRQADDKKAKDAKSESARIARLQAYAKQNGTKLEPRSGPMATSGAGIPQDKIAERDVGTEASKAAYKIAGLAMGLRKENEAKAAAENAKPLTTGLKPGTNPGDYGQVNDKAISNRLVALRNEQVAKETRQLKTKGNAVFMGSKKQVIRKEIRGGEFEGGQNRTPESIDIDDIRSADELMSWLADEKTFNQIRDAAKKSGIDVQSYDDVAKIWESVVKQAAATYSTTGKKVTPWALLQLRGKSMVNGKPAAKTTTSTSIDEMDPAQAKVMIKNSLQQMLGRDPRQDEIDDFISKAQTIARQNPNVTTTTTQFDVAGDPVSQSSVSKGGGDVVTAKAQLAAEAAAEDAPDYAQYQAAGVYAPWMFEALSSPI
jgi:hypothetical protein